MRTLWLYLIASMGLSGLISASAPTPLPTSLTTSAIPASVQIGGFAAGFALLQLNKAAAKSLIESVDFSNSIVKTIARATTTLAMSELAKESLRAALPGTTATATNLGLKSVMFVELIQSILTAQEAFPLYKPSLPSSGGDTIPEPFSTAPLVIQNPWHEIPSSTSPTALIESVPFDPAISQAFNLGLMHSIAGAGTAYMGKTVGTILAKYALDIEDPKESPFLFQTIMLSVAVAMGQWLNEMAQEAIIEKPATPKDEIRFYNKMNSLGTRLFSTIDKTISALPALLATAAATGALGKGKGPNVALLAAAETLVATYQLYNYFSPSSPVILTKDDLKDQIIAALESKNYAFAYQFAHNSPAFIKELAADTVLKNAIADTLYQAEFDLVQAASKVPPGTEHIGPTLSTQLKYLTDIWHALEYSSK